MRSEKELTEEERLYEQQNTRAICAGVILRALRDFTDLDDEEIRQDAEEWLMDTEYDNLEIDTENMTFPQACANLCMDPSVIRKKIKGMSQSELICLGAQLRRKKVPEEEEGSAWDVIFSNR